MSDTQTTQTTTPPTGSPPADQPLLAGKYKSTDDLFKGVNELRKSLDMPESKYDDPTIAEAEYKSLQKLHSKVGQTKGQPPKLSVGDSPTIPDDFDIQSATAKTGLNEEEVYKHYVEKGDLSDEHFAAIRKEFPWMSRKVATKLVEGEAAKRQVQAIAHEKSVSDALSEIGGNEGWQELKGWASQNIDKGEWADFNKRLDNPATVKSAVRELAYLRSMAGGQSAPAKSPGVVSGMRGSGIEGSVKEAYDLLQRANSGEPGAAVEFGRKYAKRPDIIEGLRTYRK